MPRQRKYQSDAERQQAYRNRREVKDRERSLERAAYVVLRDKMVAANLVHETANTREVIERFAELMQYYCSNPLAEYVGWNGSRMDAPTFECYHGFAPGEEP